MLKFFRKYNKILLVVGGSFLMVAFLAPQAIQHLFVNPGARTMLVIDGREVTLKELGERELERAALEAYLGVVRPPALTRAVLGEDGAHWILLTEAARDAGFVGEAGDGRSWLDEIVPSLVRQEIERRRQQGPASQIDPQAIESEVVTQLNQIAIAARGRGRLTEEQFAMALARARGVERMIDAYLSANRVAAQPVLAEAARRIERARVRWALIPGDAADPGSGEPTDDELRAHYERFRDQSPEDNEFGIGYVLPPRVRLEYLTLDRGAIERYIQIPRYEVIQAYNLLDEQPPDREEALSRLERELHTERVEEVFAAADRAIRRAVGGATRGLESDGPYLVLPDGWSPPRMEDLAEDVWRELDSSFGRGSAEEDQGEVEPFPRPEVSVLDSQWRTRADLAALEGIGSARVRVGTQTVPFPDMALSVRQIAGENPLGVQVEVPGVRLPLRDALGNRYYVTVLAARGRSSPDSFEEVRDRVATDYKALAGYRELEARIGEIESVVSTEGIDAVASMFEPGEPSIDDADTGTDENPITTGRAIVWRGAVRVEPESSALDVPAFRRVVEAVRAARQADAPIDEQQLSNALIQVAIQTQQFDLEGIRTEVFRAVELEEALDAARLRDTVFDLVAAMDPTVSVEEVVPARRSLAVLLPGARSAAAGRIAWVWPLTRQSYRLSSLDIAREYRSDELVRTQQGDPFGAIERAFGFDALAARYSVKDMRSDDGSEFEDSEPGTDQARSESGGDSPAQESPAEVPPSGGDARGAPSPSDP